MPRYSGMHVAGLGSLVQVCSSALSDAQPPLLPTTV